MWLEMVGGGWRWLNLEMSLFSSEFRHPNKAANENTSVCRQKSIHMKNITTCALVFMCLLLKVYAYTIRHVYITGESSSEIAGNLRCHFAFAY